LLRFSIFSFVSSIFIVIHWGTFIMAALKYLSDDANFPVILMGHVLIVLLH
jgi:hypothetical protein